MARSEHEASLSLRWGSEIAGQARDGAVCLLRGFWVGTDLACVLSGMEVGGGRGWTLNGMKKEQGATSCSTRAPCQPLMHFIFNPHHGLLSTGYYAHLPDGETEAQRSANGSSGVMQPESGGAGLWAGNPGPVHGARPNAGSEKCRQAEEGELAQGPWGAPPPAWLPVPTRGAAGAAHCLSAAPRRSWQASLINPQPARWIQTLAPGSRRPVRAEPRDGPVSPPRLLF